MSRQQAPQPVVRPVQVGDSIPFISDTSAIERNRWYIARTGFDKGGEHASEPSFIYIGEPGTPLKIAACNDTQLYRCQLDGTAVVKALVCTTIEEIDLDLVQDYIQYFNLNYYELVTDTPVNVVGWFDL